MLFTERVGRKECQATSASGGARVDGDPEKRAAGAFARASTTLPAMLRANAEVAEGRGLAYCAVVVARQQSWLQQPEP